MGCLVLELTESFPGSRLVALCLVTRGHRTVPPIGSIRRPAGIARQARGGGVRFANRPLRPARTPGRPGRYSRGGPFHRLVRAPVPVNQFLIAVEERGCHAVRFVSRTVSSASPGKRAGEVALSGFTSAEDVLIMTIARGVVAPGLIPRAYYADIGAGSGIATAQSGTTEGHRRLWNVDPPHCLAYVCTNRRKSTSSSGKG